MGMNGWFHVVTLQNTHRQPLPIRGCWTELETVKKEREIEMWRRAVAQYSQSKTTYRRQGQTHMYRVFFSFLKSSTVTFLKLSFQMI